MNDVIPANRAEAPFSKWGLGPIFSFNPEPTATVMSFLVRRRFRVKRAEQSGSAEMSPHPEVS
jgi:hypothetical protein